MGAVCHTINPRLSVEQIIDMINHAEDMAVFFDLAFIDLVHPLMTETSPIATVSKSLCKHGASSRIEPRSRQVKQGRASFGVESGICDGNDRNLTHDGRRSVAW
jgi:hypothetical protein